MGSGRYSAFWRLELVSEGLAARPATGQAAVCSGLSCLVDFLQLLLDALSGSFPLGLDQVGFGRRAVRKLLRELGIPDGKLLQLPGPFRSDLLRLQLVFLFPAQVGSVRIKSPRLIARGCFLELF